MRPQFHEDYLSPEQDTLDGKSAEFDWDALYKLFGESQQELSAHDYDSLSFALKRILEWVLSIDLERPGFESIMARRVLALAWTMNPAYFEDSPSLSRIAERIGTHKASLSSYAASASRTFGVRNRGQVHGWNFKSRTKEQANAASTMSRADVPAIAECHESASDAATKSQPCSN